MYSPSANHEVFRSYSNFLVFAYKCHGQPGTKVSLFLNCLVFLMLMTSSAAALTGLVIHWQFFQFLDGHQSCSSSWLKLLKLAQADRFVFMTILPPVRQAWFQALDPSPGLAPDCGPIVGSDSSFHKSNNLAKYQNQGWYFLFFSSEQLFPRD